MTIETVKLRWKKPHNLFIVKHIYLNIYNNQLYYVHDRSLSESSWTSPIKAAKWEAEVYYFLKSRLLTERSEPALLAAVWLLWCLCLVLIGGSCPGNAAREGFSLEGQCLAEQGLLPRLPLLSTLSWPSGTCLSTSQARSLRLKHS